MENNFVHTRNHYADLLYGISSMANTSCSSFFMGRTICLYFNRFDGLCSIYRKEYNKQKTKGLYMLVVVPTLDDTFSHANRKRTER
ncbi:hypothetical protein BPJM79_40347 [Bacillus pumilus]